MVGTLRLFCTTSHNCLGKMTFFCGEVVLSGGENVVKGAVWICLLSEFFVYFLISFVIDIVAVTLCLPMPLLFSVNSSYLNMVFSGITPITIIGEYHS